MEINPDNYIAHYYKGVVLSSQAYEMEPASARKDVYAQARESLERARELMEAQEETPDELEELNETIVSYWADEYNMRSEEHTSELQSRGHLVCRLLLE